MKFQVGESFLVPYMGSSLIPVWEGKCPSFDVDNAFVLKCYLSQSFWGFFMNVFF